MPTYQIKGGQIISKTKINLLKSDTKPNQEEKKEDKSETITLKIPEKKSTKIYNIINIRNIISVI